MNMPTRFRVPSKSSGRSYSSRRSRQSRSSQDTSSATTMDIRDAAQPCFSFPSSVSHRHSYRDHGITQWVVSKDEVSCEDTSYTRGQPHMTDSSASLLTGNAQTTSGASWDNAMPIDNLIVDQCQPFITNDPYQLSTSGGTSNPGTQPLFDPLAIDPSMNLSTALYPGTNALAVSMSDDSFKNDFTSGPISYGSSNSMYMSPPVSPELEGQNFPGLPVHYGANGEYATQGTTNFMYPQVRGFSQRPSSPPSPPMSDSDPYAALTSAQQPLLGSQAFMETFMQEADACQINRAQGHHRGSEPATSSTSAKISPSTGHTSNQSSRPAQRVLKPASEKPRGYDQGSQSVALSAHTKPKEKPETAQPRNHHLYKALPGKDGLFRCPFARETLCAHTPTKQKCGYE
jgi:hypothetical protein